MVYIHFTHCMSHYTPSIHNLYLQQQSHCISSGHISGGGGGGTASSHISHRLFSGLLLYVHIRHAHIFLAPSMPGGHIVFFIRSRLSCSSPLTLFCKVSTCARSSRISSFISARFLSSPPLNCFDDHGESMLSV